MPIQGNMGPIMRRPEPPKRDEKGAMILGSFITRSELIEYMQKQQKEAEEKRNYQPPPPPPTARQAAQTALEIEAGQRALERAAAKMRPMDPPVEESYPIYVPPDGEGTADVKFVETPPVVTGIR